MIIYEIFLCIIKKNVILELVVGYNVRIIKNVNILGLKDIYFMFCFEK